jgi:RNase P subunit RPR2
MSEEYSNLINLTAKKVYCPKCQKLVRVKLTQSGEKKQYACLICNTVMWQKEGLKWKYQKAD